MRTILAVGVVADRDDGRGCGSSDEPEKKEKET